MVPGVVGRRAPRLTDCTLPSAPPSLESVPNCGAHPDPLLQPGSIFPARSPPAQLWRAGEEGCADSPRCSLPWWRPMLRSSQPVSGLSLPLRTFCSARLCVCVQEFAFPSGPSSIQGACMGKKLGSQGCGKP